MKKVLYSLVEPVYTFESYLAKKKLLLVLMCFDLLVAIWFRKTFSLLFMEVLLFACLVVLFFFLEEWLYVNARKEYIVFQKQELKLFSGNYWFAKHGNSICFLTKLNDETCTLKSVPVSQVVFDEMGYGSIYYERFTYKDERIRRKFERKERSQEVELSIPKNRVRLSLPKGAI